MELILIEQGFIIQEGTACLLECRPGQPMLYAGYGEEDIDMYRGNFKIEDYLTERYPLAVTDIQETENGCQVNFSDVIQAAIKTDSHLLDISFKKLDAHVNRFWLRIHAKKDEKCYGCGEQMSYFNLRGRKFPLWTSEPGVGRDKTTYLTWLCDVNDRSGGDYYNTYFPEATYVSSRKYYLHADSTAYAVFDFRHDDFHELQFWDVPASVRIETADSFVKLAEKLTALLGRQPELPDWIYDGVIIGLQGGTERMMALTKKTLDAGIKVNGVWCQDWEGKRVTSFGDRLQWDWHWNEKRYPELPEKIKELEKGGIRFLGYMNPYLVNDGEQYKEGAEKGYFVLDQNDGIYQIDFGEFYCGCVDFTNPDAYNWFKEIIKNKLIGFGLSGWMADFGEYLPTDCKLYNGESPMIEHNHWPALWAKCNYEAVKEAGRLGDVVYFMRAGATGSQKYCPLLWTGDQSVDFTIHDGLASVIPAALSAGICGCGVTHSDIGGYTSLYDNVRTRELFLRWADMNVFTPVMRTHESNRPATNFQYYDDEEAMRIFARQTDIHVALKPYLKRMVKENAERGLPVQRPLFMHYEDDAACYDIQTSYLLGEDMLVAPVYLEGQTEREVYLPDDVWVELWTGKEYGQGTVAADAPIGYTPVFYRKNAKDRALFEKIGRTFGRRQ